MSFTFAFQRLLRAARRFARADRGNLSLIMGLSLIPLMVCAGAAVDIERAVNARTQLQSALDTAALYAAQYAIKNKNTTDATLTSISRPFLDNNYQNLGDSTISNYNVADDGQYVTASATVNSDNKFMQIVGQNSISMAVSSKVEKSGWNLEVSLVLDNTGSMAGSPMTKLVAAANSFVDKVMPDVQGSYFIKVAVVPYNNGVNTGSANIANAVRGSIISTPTTSTSPGYNKYQFSTASGGTNTFSITNCVSERVGSLAYSDASVVATAYPPVSLNPVGRSYLGSSNGNTCSVTPYRALTTDKTALKNTISAMSAGNSTAGQVGVAWGWYVLSPLFGIYTDPGTLTSPKAQVAESIPQGYDKLTTSDLAKRTRKIMILMTDGEYNSAFANGVISGKPSVYGSGSSSDQINRAPDVSDVYTQANNMCIAIKKSGVEIYVITFQLSNGGANGAALVKNCASDSAHLIDADSMSLDSAFQKIANQILAMRVTG